MPSFFGAAPFWRHFTGPVLKPEKRPPTVEDAFFRRVLWTVFRTLKQDRVLSKNRPCRRNAPGKARETFDCLQLPVEPGRGCGL